MFDKHDVRLALTPDAYLGELGYEFHRAGKSLRGPCPFCGGSDYASKFVIDGDLWHCKACNKGGDVISLHAHLQRIPFARAVNELGQRLHLQQRSKTQSINLQMEAVKKRAEDAVAHARGQEEACSKAKDVWDKLEKRSLEGEKYLASRGVVSAEPRFGKDYVCLPLYDTTGDIINVVGRRFRGEGLRIISLEGCSTTGSFGNPTDIGCYTSVAFTEGFFDYLSAQQLASGETKVLGVHGCTNMSALCALLGPSIKRHEVLFFPHNDAAGKDAVAESKLVLRCCGAPAENIKTFMLPERINDLNDALAAKALDFKLEIG